MYKVLLLLLLSIGIISVQAQEIGLEYFQSSIQLNAKVEQQKGDVSWKGRVLTNGRKGFGIIYAAPLTNKIPLSYEVSYRGSLMDMTYQAQEKITFSHEVYLVSVSEEGKKYMRTYSMKDGKYNFNLGVQSMSLGLSYTFNLLKEKLYVQPSVHWVNSVYTLAEPQGRDFYANFDSSDVPNVYSYYMSYRVNYKYALNDWRFKLDIGYKLNNKLSLGLGMDFMSLSRRNPVLLNMAEFYNVKDAEGNISTESTIYHYAHIGFKSLSLSLNLNYKLFKD